MNQRIIKSKHIPKKLSKNKNIIRCLIFSIEERTLLTFDMCNISKELYYRMLNVLIEQNIAIKIEDHKPIVDTTDLIIYDYTKANIYLKNGFLKCLKMIEENLIPLLNLVHSVIKSFH